MTESDTETRRAAGRPLTGRTVLAITLCAFGVIFGANMALVTAATGSFPGTVVDNSYHVGVGWNDRAAAQDALGWTVTAGYTADGALAVGVADAAGEPVRGVAVEAVVGRPANADDDVALVLRPDGARHVAPVALGPGLWRVAIAVEGGATPYRAVAEIVVPRERAAASAATGEDAG